MSAGQLASNLALSQGSGRSRAGTESSHGGDVPVLGLGKRFEPCATTASMFLYAQGASILCLHHDTLAVDRRFQRHADEVLFISVDNQSERGAGRLVVSYDAGQTAIVWDLFTGDEVARFASYDPFCVAAWMRNGNVAFGNILGNVTLFEPSTSEHVSARTIFDPITAIAPAADCRTYAIGYNNGSILIAALQPSFIILHTLTTHRAPSPIVTLAWHGSSSKQKSDMLATQTQDGDLRVWSISKPPHNELPKVIRVLKRSDIYEPGLNWLAWSKNGRIVQFSEGVTSSWDVRTKHVTYEAVPTLESVSGLAIHGPTATLFTLGSNHTVQQFDLSPPTLVANKQHPPPIPPPSPPVSVEEQKDQGATTAATAPYGPRQTQPGAGSRLQSSESEEESLSPLQKIASEMNQIEESRQLRSGTLSPTSSASRSQGASVRSKSSGGSKRYRSTASVSSKATSREGTAFSYGSSIHSSRTSSTGTWASSPSVASSQRSRGRSSRLRNEVLRSPEGQIVDLFPYTRGRLDDVPYLNPQNQDTSQLTPADLRKQMLSVVFGWEDDIEALIQEELRRHPQGSASAVLLSKWLGDVDADMMASMVGTETMTSSDWMLLALSGFGGQASTKKVGQAFVQRLLEKRDVHAAATILLGLGDQNDAVEIYVSHRLFMEAVLLTCLIFPNDWQRQSALVRKWGEYAVQHSQQHLAIRCFSCTGCETSGVLTSPRAYDNESGHGPYQSLPQILSPPMSPPGTAGSSRLTAKTATLKLITTFGDKNSANSTEGRSKFFGLGAEDTTPMGGAGVTPIADSAISPGAAMPHLGPSSATSRSSRHPDSARTATPGGVSRRRLPSIGETPIDITPRAINPKALPTPVDSGSDREKDGPAEQAPLTLSSATYNPHAELKSPVSQASGQVLPSPAHNAFTDVKADARTRNGSRDRKPDGLQIRWPPIESIVTGEYMSPGSDMSKERRPRHSRSNTDPRVYTPLDISSQFASPLPTGSSLNSVRSPLQTGRSMDKYISSLEEANFYAKKQRGASRTRQGSRDGRRRGSEDDRADRGRNQSRGRVAKELDEPGRAGARYIKPAKRSPSSPVPMSPDDFPYRSTDSREDESYYNVASPVEPRGERESRMRAPSSNRRRDQSTGSRVRRRSPERAPGSRAGSRLGPRGGSRTASRQQSPAAGERDARGRSSSRAEGSVMRSPSSPLPMSPQAKLYRDEEEEELRAVEEDRKRFRSRQRSTSRRPQERGQSGRREDSPDRRYLSRSHQNRGQSRGDRREHREYSPGGKRQELQSPTGESGESSEELRRRRSLRALKKEIAARELEARRKSLARRPSAPAIPSPGDVSAGRSPVSAVPRPVDALESPSSVRSYMHELADRAPPRSKTTSPDGSNVSMGLPATPRAMRHPRYMNSDMSEDIPAVPEIPDNLPNLGTTHHASKEQDRDEPGPLPSTVYSSSIRPPARSVSAPIPEEPASPAPFPAALPTHPAFQHAVPPSTRRRGTPGHGEGAAAATARAPTGRRINPGEAQPGQLGYESRGGSPVYIPSPQPVILSIDETIQASKQQDANPAPPSQPVVLPELKHLALPPPPPPPPAMAIRPAHSHSNSTSTTGTDVGVINIGIGLEDKSRGTTPVVEVPPPPQPSQSAQGHGHSRKGSLAEATSRGRSAADNISGKFSRATQRMRSKSGSRVRAKSPPTETGPVFRALSPYESVPGPSEGGVGFRGLSPYESVGPPAQALQSEVPVRSQTVSPGVERHPREVKAGLTPEMIRTGFAEGGMI
ncbi:MAG: hypothetical protein M1832_003634 [Thelocarpon impressellum]|nr:MAG: hypothetical protein M1832_003634 [Thelocarpon impressellum]